LERNLHNRTLALAALFQCIGEVDRLAQSGQSDPAIFAAMIGSVLKLEAPSLESVYGGVETLRPGLELLRRQLGAGSQPRDMELMRYAVAVLYLERRLDTNPEITQQLGRGVDAAQRQSKYF
jgi:high frequency lysogenization protein